MIDLHDALSRTALLIRRDVFPTLTEQEITERLLGRRVALIADEANLATPAGQTALVATAIALAQTGAQLTLDVPDVALISAQPPIAPSARLRAGLTELVDDLLQPAAAPGAAATDIDVIFGDTQPAGPRARTVLRVSGDGWSVRLRPGTTLAGTRWTGTAPFGGLLAGVAVSAESLRAALADLGEQNQVTPLPEHQIGARQDVSIDLDPLELPYGLDLGALDVISAGAITNSALAALLRVADLRAQARIVDADVGAVSNLNRYALLNGSTLGIPKVDALARLATCGFEIEPLAARFDADSLERILPLAPTVLVGVDDIPSRWLVQSHVGDWLCVAGTSRMEIVVSEHVPGGPCAGCMHPYDDPDDGLIPTVAFVSQLAGVLQAYRLLRHALGLAAQPPTIAYGLGLGGARPLMTLGQLARADCPVGCAAARAA